MRSRVRENRSVREKLNYSSWGCHHNGYGLHNDNCVQAGLRLVEEARRKMRERLADNTVNPESGRRSSSEVVYQAVYMEVLETCEGQDLEEFVALCPKLDVMKRAFTKWKKEMGLTKKRKKKTIEIFNGALDEAVERDQTEMKFISKTSGNGRVFHSFANNLYRFDRYQVTPSGRAYFNCSVQGCKAVLRADYTSNKTRDLEEPSLHDAPTFSSHVLENGRIHPVQAGLRMVEEARRRMKNMVAENPVKPVPHVYKEVQEEIIMSCDERDRDDLISLFPPFEAMARSLYKWRKEWFAGYPSGNSQ